MIDDPIHRSILTAGMKDDASYTHANELQVNRSLSLSFLPAHIERVNFKK